MKKSTWRSRRALLTIAELAFLVSVCNAAATSAHTCRRVELEGEVSAGQEWKMALGQGWSFRVLPIAPVAQGYSGWDLAVDRDPPAGYPDALLLATLPYNSINEREVGTTFGLRAQDAIGWNPRSFRFLTDPAAFRQAQRWFRQVAALPQGVPAASNPATADTVQHLLQLEDGASSGQFRILNARIVPGTADPQPFAQAWALAFMRTQHQIEPVAAGQASPQGKLVWMRFALTLWFPSNWNFPAEIHSMRASCPE
jgi:hypothetical protein